MKDTCEEEEASRAIKHVEWQEQYDEEELRGKQNISLSAKNGRWKGKTRENREEKTSICKNLTISTFRGRSSVNAL